jgi:hypothetical protein
LIVAVSPDVIPSGDKPVKFTIVADASGYTKSTRMVVFTNQSNQGVWIPMYNENNPPAGVSSKEVIIPNAQEEYFRPIRPFQRVHKSPKMQVLF